MHGRSAKWGFLVLLVCGAAVPFRAAAVEFSDEACLDLVARFEKSLRDKDVEGFLELFDAEALADRLLAGIKTPPAVRRDTVERIREELSAFPRDQPIALGQHGTIRLLAVVRNPQWARLRIRIISGELVRVALELQVQAEADGPLRVVDFHNFTRGVTLSTALRRLMLPEVRKQGGTMLGQSAFDRDYLAQRELYDEFNATAKPGNAAEALAIHKRLPKSLRDDRLVMCALLNVVSGDDFLAVMNRFLELFPRDANTVQLQIVGAQVAGEWEKIPPLCDEMDAVFAKDPWMELERGMAFKNLQRVDDAIAAYQRCLEAEPEQAVAYLLLCEIYARQQAWSQVAASLDALLATPMGKDVRIEGNPLFGDFCSTPEFEAWKPRGEAHGYIFNSDVQNLLAEVIRLNQAKDTAGLASLWHYPALADRVLEGIDVPHRFRDELIDGFRLGFSQAEMFSGLGERSMLRLLDTSRANGETRVRIRALLPDGDRLNLELLMVRDYRGQVRLADLVNYTRGTSIVGNIRRRTLPEIVAKAEQPPSLSAMEQELVANQELCRQFFRHLDAAKPAEAKASYDQFPQTLQDDRDMLCDLIAVLPRGEGTTAFNRLRELFPEDLTVKIVAAAKANHENDYERALQLYDEIDAAFAKDPWLDLERARVLKAMNRLDEAEAAASRGVEHEPEQFAAHMLLVDILLTQKKWSKLGPALDGLLAHPERKDLIVETNARFKEFVQSPEYQTWKRSRR